MWNPNPEPDETAIWTGPCVDGYAQGQGTLQWLRSGKTEETDEGEWKAGRQTGRGTQDWNAGRYEGALLDGEPHGHGVLALRTSRYEGEFRNGKANGHGTATRMDGVFKGIWKDGCFLGDQRKIAIGVQISTCR